MTDKHYDVVVLGTSLGALLAAAVLARRGFRVLVLGQGAKPPSYRFGPHVLRRSAHTMLSASTPVFRRALAELAQSQAFRRRAISLDPMVAVLMHNRRVEIPPDRVLFDREIEREFPEAKRGIGDLYAELGQWNAAVDAALEHDIVLPPGTFWERRRATRLFAAIPRLGDGTDPLSALPSGHAYRRIVKGLVGFGTDLSTPTGNFPAFALARLHGNWTRGTLALPGGEQEAMDLFVDRIVAQGGTVRPRDRAVRVVPGRGSALEVSIDGDTTPTGAAFVLHDDTGESLAQLSQGEGILGRAERDWPRITAVHGRFTMSLIVRAMGIPEPLPRESLVLVDRDETAASSSPWDAFHVVKMDAREPGSTDLAKDTVLLVVEALVPLDAAGTVPSAQASSSGHQGLAFGREKVLEALGRALPFLQSHLVAVDSPHDGRPLWAYEAGTRRDVDRAHLSDASAQPEPMVPKYAFDPPSLDGLAGEPLRGPLSRTFLVGRTVLPALGQEGQVLSGLGAALLVTRSDRQKERMRQAMWSRIEIG